MNKSALLIDSLWKKGDDFRSLHARLRHDADDFDPVFAAVVGKELFMRLKALSTPEFSKAAYLASGGLAGNDGLTDFRDCVMILPYERYSKILENHDELVDDPVSFQFEEYNFLGIFERAFESSFGEEGVGLLEHLVCDGDQFGLEANPVVDAKALFPRLFQRHGHLLEENASADLTMEKGVTLENLLE